VPAFSPSSFEQADALSHQPGSSSMIGLFQENGVRQPYSYLIRSCFFGFVARLPFLSVLQPKLWRFGRASSRTFGPSAV
jgi:hypothetical protein